MTNAPLVEPLPSPSQLGATVLPPPRDSRAAEIGVGDQDLSVILTVRAIDTTAGHCPRSAYGRLSSVLVVGTAADRCSF